MPAALVLGAVAVGAAGALGRRAAPAGPARAAAPAVGQLAPDLPFTSLSGKPLTVGSLRGRPALLWLVTTWCSSCQAGTQVMAQQLPLLARRGVRVVELELYQDLGGAGPGLAAFARQSAGPAAANRDWLWGYASRQLSFTYDPAGYLDIYYLLDASGRIRWVSGSPAATMPSLLGAVSTLAPGAAG